MLRHVLWGTAMTRKSSISNHRLPPKSMAGRTICFRHRDFCLFAAVAALALVGDAHCAEAQAQPQGFSVPVSCDPNSECLVQQYPDMMPGSGVADPFCGQASYDGHDGTDIRIASLKSVAAGVPVVAMRDGRVLRLRDGEPDRLIETAAARETVASKECGNGLVIDHGDGWSVQYCHLRQGSIRVRPGQFVKRGEQLGLVGASGLAQFPHVHVTVRRSGLAVDPATGQEVGSGCIRNAPQRRPLWALEALGWLKAAQHHIIDAGLTGTTLDYDNLVREGAPPAINKDSAAVVG